MLKWALSRALTRNAAPHTHPRFEKIFGAFYKSKGMAPESVKFKYNGAEVTLDSTPDSLDMEEGDVVDAFLQQTGGGCPGW